MNRIVKDHYPAERLPDDLRADLPEGADVRITIEVLPAKMSPEELLAHFASIARDASPTNTNDAVARVRELRDEWDD